MVLYKIRSVGDFTSHRDLIISSYMTLRGTKVLASDVDLILDANNFRHHSISCLVDIYNCNSALKYIRECKESLVYTLSHQMIFTLLQFLNRDLSATESIIVGDHWIRNPHTLVSEMTKICNKHYGKPKDLSDMFVGVLADLSSLKFIPKQVEDGFLYIIAQHLLLCFGNSVLTLRVDDSIDDWKAAVQDGLEGIHVSGTV